MKRISSRHFFLATGLLMLPLGALAPAVRAQSAGSGLEVPSGPLLSPAPEFSHWVETFSYPEERQPKAGAAPVVETQTRTITTTKTKKIVHEETVSAQGEKRDDWYMGTTQYSKVPSSPTWILGATVVTTAGGFRDLDWVVEANYIGTTKLSGKSCLVFTMNHPGTVTPSVSEQLLGTLDSLATVAYIDATSRLPVQVREYGIIRTYQFTEPPTEMQTPPSDLAQDLKKAEDLRARFNRPLQSN